MASGVRYNIYQEFFDVWESLLAAFVALWEWWEPWVVGEENALGEFSSRSPMECGHRITDWDSHGNS